MEGLAGSDIPAFGWAGTSLTWSEWSGLVRRFQDELEGLRGTPVGLVLRPEARSYALWRALSLRDCHVHLLDEAMPAQALETLSERHQLAFLVNAGEGNEALEWVRPCGTGASGRSGRDHPVHVRKHRPAQAGRARLGNAHATGPRAGRLGPGLDRQVWLLSYRPHLYAGIQVYLHCLLNRGPWSYPSRDCRRKSWPG